jgi:hypothetical protein
MSDTVRQQIVDNLITRLKTMSIASGYSADYNLITAWNIDELKQAQLPAVVVYDTELTVENYNFQTTNNRLEIIIGVFQKGQAGAPQVRDMIRDVYNCLGADLYCGGLATEIKPVSESLSMTSQKDTVLWDIQLTFHVLFANISWQIDKVI